MDEFKDLIIKTIRKTVDTYIKETRELFLSKGISLEDAEYVIDLFEKWRLETIESLQNGIGRIFSSQYHRSKFEKLFPFELPCTDTHKAIITVFVKTDEFSPVFNPNLFL